MIGHCLDKTKLEIEIELFVKLVEDTEKLSGNSLLENRFVQIVSDYVGEYCNNVCRNRQECKKYCEENHSKKVIDADCEGADQLVRAKTREENQQILKHKWNLSEAAGRDVGFDFAREDFKKNHQQFWEVTFKERYCSEICQYELTCKKRK